MVKVNNLKRIKELHDSLLDLDKEILSIEKIANELVSDKCKIKLHIEVENTSKPKEKVRFDEDGSLISPSAYNNILGLSRESFNFMYPLTTSQLTPTPPSNQTTLTFTDSQCLSALDIILR